MEEMAEDWDNCCPLCMEEMDPTDRQLKPCRCGYQVIESLHTSIFHYFYCFSFLVSIASYFIQIVYVESQCNSFLNLCNLQLILFYFSFRNTVQAVKIFADYQLFLSKAPFFYTVLK
jgi:hypothetical protein